MALPQPVKYITPEEYLRIERAAEFKSEYFAGEMFAMAGGSPEHSLLKTNVIGELRSQLKGRPYTVYDSDLRVLISATGLFVYPDATVVCGPLETSDEQKDTVVNPTLVVEVMSDSTEVYDRTTKFDHYRRVPSLQDIVFVSQKTPIIERFSRGPDGVWFLVDAQGLEATLELPSIGVSLSLAEVYDKIEFHELPPRMRRLQP